MNSLPSLSVEAGSLVILQESTQGANDLVKAVDKLLNDLGPKFSKVSVELFAKSGCGPEPLFCVVLRLTTAVDDMAQRLDDMESAVKAGNESGSEGN